jgi:hypothetical protein
MRASRLASESAFPSDMHIRIMGTIRTARTHITRIPITGRRFTSDRRFTGTTDGASIIRAIAITVTGAKQTIEKL